MVPLSEIVIIPCQLSQPRMWLPYNWVHAEWSKFWIDGPLRWLNWNILCEHFCAPPAGYSRYSYGTFTYEIIINGIYIYELYFYEIFIYALYFYKPSLTWSSLFLYFCAIDLWLHTSTAGQKMRHSSTAFSLKFGAILRKICGIQNGHSWALADCSVNPLADWALAD